MVGEIDSFTGREWEAVIGGELEKRPRCLVIDLTRVESVGSSALAILCRAWEECFRHGTQLPFVGAGREDVLVQLWIAGLDRLFVPDG